MGTKNQPVSQGKVGSTAAETLSAVSTTATSTSKASEPSIAPMVRMMHLTLRKINLEMSFIVTV